MESTILATAAALSDQELLVRLDALAGKEREASVELVAHLSALDTRPALYASQGFGSLFGYCTQALRLSEDAACNRIEAARACRRFPAILDLLISGSLSLTSVRLLGRHLTAENHQAVLARARGRSRREIEALVAELAPRPDVPASVRKLPVPQAMPPTPVSPVQTAGNVASTASDTDPTIASSPDLFLKAPRPIVQPTSPGRYRVQFTIGRETHDELRRLQSLLRREIPNGDEGAIFARALSLLLEKVEKAKLGAAARPRGAIRPGTDTEGRNPARRSRYIPRDVRREVWRRDAGQCAFVAPTGRRCTERTFLDLHHCQPYANQGPATVANISLRCRRHNEYEAELIFGPHGASIVRERPLPYGRLLRSHQSNRLRPRYGTRKRDWAARTRPSST
jgi:hypothetical protein